MIWKFIATCIILSTCQLAVAKHLSNAEISEFGGCYFAPITSGGIWRMRTQDGEIREFEIDAKKPDRLLGVGGWWAAMRRNGSVSVHAPATGEYPPLVYNFTKGRLMSLDVEGKHCKFGYPDPLVYDDSVIKPLWPDTKKVTREEFAKDTTMWKDGRRLTMWFASPNQAGAFLSFVFLVFLGIALSSRLGKRMRFAASILVVAAFAAIVLTASRGALLGACFGAVAMAVCDGRVRSWLTLKRLAIGFVACAVVAVGLFFAMYSGARDRQSDAKSDATRMEMVRAVPAMMCASASGWDGFNGAGRAYFEWFAPLSDTKIQLNLISDHLTMLAGSGWLVGFLYVFAWLAGLSALAKFAWRGGSSMPLGVWTSLGVAASFNVVMFAPTILWVPCAVLLVLVFDRRWLSLRFFSVPIAIAVVGACLTLGAIVVAGHVGCRAEPSILRDGNCVLVNGKAPDIWIVDDEECLGGVLAPRDIRTFYSRFPTAPAIGYAKDVDDVPTKGVKRLVLAGSSADGFMAPYSRNPEAVVIPPEIIFLAPQFPPIAIPDELRAKSRVIMVVGEFAARYWEEFSNAPDWVGVIPGAEVYIPDWMMQCVETSAKGEPK